MVNIPDHVEPGDLVKSVEYNGIIDVLHDLLNRVQLLEGGVGGIGVAITSIVPSGDLRVGQEITIFGRNFGFSIGAQRVFFNSARVTIFKTGSNDQKLIIEIPNVTGVTEAGTPVTITAANFSSSDSRTVTLRPVQLNQQGNISLSFLNVTPVTVIVGSKPKFKYQLEAPVLLPQPVLIEPTVSIASLQNTLKVLDAGDQELANRQLTLQPGQSTQISIQLDSIPVGTTQFNLKVKASGAGVAGSEDNRLVTIGATVEVDEEITSFAPLASSPPEALQGSTVSVPAGTSVFVKFAAQFIGNDLRTYDVLSAVLAPATNWGVELGTGFFATPPTYTISAPGSETPAYKITPLAGASTSAVIEFTLKRQGSNKKRTSQLTFNRT
jgi:hypothetical protein